MELEFYIPKLGLVPKYIRPVRPVADLIQEYPLDDRADFSVQVEEMLRSMYDIYSPGKNYEHMVHPTGTTVLTYCGTQPQEPSPGASPGRVPSAGKARHRYMHFLIYIHAPTVWGACMQCSGIHEQAAAYEVKCTNSRSS